MQVKDGPWGIPGSAPDPDQSITIIEDLLTINEFSRPGKKLKEVRGVTIHWTANVGLDAKGNRDFYEDRKLGTNGYGSAHYIIGYEGEIIRCIPEDEVAYHCGTSQIDPISGKIYTDYAREKFGNYCLPTSSPNNCTLGIEMCPLDWKGNVDLDTWNSTKKIIAILLRKYNLGIGDITTHENIVGWKFCPMLFHLHPEELDTLKNEVSVLL